MMDSDLVNAADLILTQMPAPPVAIRPAVSVSATCTNQDDLTVSLANMAYINSEIEKVIAKGNSSNKLLELWSNL
jgi:DNA-directed RNA polymerase beta' subunit